jgi:hypothetical protein
MPWSRLAFAGSPDMHGRPSCCSVFSMSVGGAARQPPTANPNRCVPHEKRNAKRWGWRARVKYPLPTQVVPCQVLGRSGQARLLDFESPTIKSAQRRLLGLFCSELLGRPRRLPSPQMMIRPGHA